MLTTSCCTPTPSAVTPECDYSIYFIIDQYGNVTANYTGDPLWDQCTDTLANIVLGKNVPFYVGSGRHGWNVQSTNDDCYSFSGPNLTTVQMMAVQQTRQAMVLSRAESSGASAVPLITDGKSRFVDQAVLYNPLSTDPYGSFPCYSLQAAERYLNSTAVRRAIHIPTGLDSRSFQICK